MLYPTSGRCGFDMISSRGEKKIELEVLKKMLKRENELRLTHEIQTKYDECALTDAKKYTKLTEDLQKQVLTEFGFDPSNGDLTRYRSALAMYPEEKELKDLVYYYKYNRSRDGTLQVGDSVSLSTLRLSTLDGTSEVALSTFVTSESLPLVLVAGSIT